MNSRIKTIRGILEQLYSELGSAHACLVAKEDLEGVIMFPDTFKSRASPIWSPLSCVLQSMLVMVAENMECPFDRLYVELFDFSIIFLVLPNTDTALITICDKNSFKKLDDLVGLMEGARDRIMSVEFQ
ncbi:MAG: hypothetical protein GF334_13715 [Candidatus Altiarchaeales archaeon]|nr:hypothetical protein [Candidatus Altiarchaeales archaeon]